MYANLFGDFVKGSQYYQYSNKVVQGIQLHREIDYYFDQHPIIVEVRRSLYPTLPKISSVALDLYIDHLLAKNWSVFHKTRFVDYLDEFYTHDSQMFDEFPELFLSFVGALKNNKWINYYQYEYGLDKACKGVSNRISFPNNLRHGLKYFKLNQERLNEAFINFMTDANKKFGIYY